MAVCVGCGEPVAWYVNDNTGNKMCLDPDPCDDGNITLVGDGKCHVLTKVEIAELLDNSLFPSEEPPPARYKTHFATCEKPEGFRGRDTKAHRVPKGPHGRQH